jgi:hypothetical protein
MKTKVTQPIMETINGKRTVTGFTIEYRLFGILLCRKTSYSISRYGITEFVGCLNP